VKLKERREIHQKRPEREVEGRRSGEYRPVLGKGDGARRRPRMQDRAYASAHWTSTQLGVLKKKGDGKPGEIEIGTQEMGRGKCMRLVHTGGKITTLYSVKVLVPRSTFCMRSHPRWFWKQNILLRGFCTIKTAVSHKDYR